MNNGKCKTVQYEIIIAPHGVNYIQLCFVLCDFLKATNLVITQNSVLFQPSDIFEPFLRLRLTRLYLSSLKLCVSISKASLYTRHISTEDKIPLEPGNAVWQ